MSVFLGKSSIHVKPTSVLLRPTGEADFVTCTSCSLCRVSTLYKVHACIVQPLRRVRSCDVCTIARRYRVALSGRLVLCTFPWMMWESSFTFPARPYYFCFYLYSSGCLLIRHYSQFFLILLKRSIKTALLFSLLCHRLLFWNLISMPFLSPHVYLSLFEGKRYIAIRAVQQAGRHAYHVSIRK